MTEIKDLLIKILEESPQIAIWVLVIIYAYKVVIAGTIYGVIKFTIKKICDTILDYKEENAAVLKREADVKMAEHSKPKEWTYGENMLVNSEAKTALEALLETLRADKKHPTGYIHKSDIQKLADAYKEDKDYQQSITT